MDVFIGQYFLYAYSRTQAQIGKFISDDINVRREIELMKNNNLKTIGLTEIFTVAIAILFMAGFLSLICLLAAEPECSQYGCDKDAIEGSRYCTLHDMSNRYYGDPDYNAVYENNRNKNSDTTTSTQKKSDSSSTTATKKSESAPTSSTSKTSTYDSYDDGYNDIYEDGDYDWDRYQEDLDYSTGVDDAMEEYYEEFGEEW